MPVYLIQAGDSDGPVKIGFAIQPYQRLAELQSANHLALRLIGLMAGDRKVEKSLHRKYDGQHILGEWFHFSVELLQEFDLPIPPPPIRPPRDYQLPICKTNINEIIESLDGTEAVAQLCQVQRTAVCNWRRTGRFPPRLYRELERVYKERFGKDIDRYLFAEVPNSMRGGE